MGVDFIERATPTFAKSWDRARVRLGTAELFTRLPECAARTAAAVIMDGARLATGEHLTVERDGDGLIALRGHSIVARFLDPPEELVLAVENSTGIAKGTVELVHEMAAIAEVSLC